MKQARSTRIPTEPVFDDAAVLELARVGKLPADADLRAFANGLRAAERIYGRDSAKPTNNEIAAEIKSLYHLAAREEFDRLATSLEHLSAAARTLLNDRGQRPNVNWRLSTASTP